MADRRRDSAVGVALLYPSLLGTYGDGGNASVLAQRLRWRGIPADVLIVDLGSPVPRADVYVLGGGEDAAQTLAVAELARDGALARAAAGGIPVFAVCAGFQILGETFLDGQGAVHAGLGLIDCRTDRLPGPRAVGELVGVPMAGGPPLTGYENHGGRTTLGPAARPLARVDTGVGNGDGTEGAVQGSVVCTYAHGPALARNPWLADLVLAMAVGEPALTPLDDTEEEALRRERLAFVRREGRSFWRRQWRPPARTS